MCFCAFCRNLVLVLVVYFLLVFVSLVVSSSASNCLERLISEMTYYMLSEMLNCADCMGKCSILRDGVFVHYFYVFNGDSRHFLLNCCEMMTKLFRSDVDQWNIVAMTTASLHRCG